MAGYIGSIPVPQATQTREAFTATSNQTTFNTGGYTAGFIDVFMNGVKLAAADFTATNGSDVVLASGAAANDIVEVVAYTAFEVLNQNFTGTTTVAALTATGAISGTSADFDGGVTIDNITIDGAEIDLSAGDLLLDVAGDIILDADGGTIKFKDGGTHIANIGNSSSDLVIENKVQDKDIKFLGDDGGAGVTALTLDMSAAGTAIFNNKVLVGTSTSSSSSDVRLVINSSGGGFAQFSINGGAGSAIGSPAASTQAFYTTTGNIGSETYTERMRIDSAGHVGISDTTPENKLTVVEDGTNVAVVKARTSAANGRASYQIGNASDNWFMGIDGANSDAFFISDVVSSSDRLVINTSGNVGIGTASPAQLLHLNRTGNSPQMRITGSSDSIDFYSYSDGALYINNSAGTGLGLLANRDIYFNGNVGIGLSTPSSQYSKNLNIRTTSNTGGAALHITDGTTGSANTDGLHIVVSSGTPYIWNRENTSMVFGTNNTERMRIESAVGHLLVGKTAPASATVGVMLYQSGNIFGTVNNNYCMRLNRTTGDGDIVQFQKDGSEVGVIFSSGGVQMGIGDGNTALLFGDNIDAILPWTTVNSGRDNAIDLGRSATRFDDIYATNGTIQTSDANEKQDIEALSDAEKRVATAAKGLIKKFRWKDKVTEKGDDARIHVGIVAQDLKAAFEAESLDPGRYAMFISTTWTDDDGKEQTRLGVRYNELLAFIIGAM